MIRARDKARKVYRDKRKEKDNMHIENQHLDEMR